MGRLTWKNPNGDWGITGLDFGKLDKTVYGAVYGALCKLKDYEDTGLSPDEIEDLKAFELSNAKKYLCELEKHRWIPVAERLPDNGETVLVTRRCRNGKQYTEQDEYYDETGFESGADEDIIAWMPMTEPYKEGT